ncbi:MAG: DUF554 family protein [Alistipes indistinctus]
MTGTIANATAIISGYARGRTDPLAASAKSVEIVFQGIGLFTLAIGISMSLKSANLLLAVLSLVIGGLIGQALNLDRHLRQLTERLQRIAKRDRRNSIILTLHRGTDNRYDAILRRLSVDFRSD